MTSKPVVLVIMDGWGVTAPSAGNAITNANLKYWDYLLANYPSALLQASGSAVGLPWGKMGNSEVGHLTIGAGRIYLQSLENINQKISDRSFFENQAFEKAFKHIKENNSKLHVMGLLGDGGVHAHQAHLMALMELINQAGLSEKTFLHLFLDGRDTAKDSGLGFMQELLSSAAKLNCCQLASVSGRYYAMDRNQNWDRTKKAYDVIAGHSNQSTEDALQAIRDSYNRGVYDEEFEPLFISRQGKRVAKVEENDAIIFFNFRSDRARQLTSAFVLDDFKEFERGPKINNLLFVGFVEYKKGLPIEVAFPRSNIEYPLARVVSESGLKQLHIAETEKYAHVTFFINGLKEEPFIGEDRILIPSPAVSSYDQQPEMSAAQIKDKVLDAVGQNKYDLIVINFANPDMVGHTGNLQAGIRAVETTSQCLSEIAEKVLKMGGQLLVTADHGNVEEMINLETQQVDKEHSNFPVPVVLIKDEYKGKAPGKSNLELYNSEIKGALVDVAPTILKMLGLPKHKDMLGIDLREAIL